VVGVWNEVMTDAKRKAFFNEKRGAEVIKPAVVVVVIVVVVGSSSNGSSKGGSSTK